MEKEYTNRGFGLYRFNDIYGDECSVQMSSLATKPAIWLGINKANPIIKSSDAIKLGLNEETLTEEDNGWTKYQIPNEVSIHTRMHLDQALAKELIEILQRFVDQGEF